MFEAPALNAAMGIPIAGNPAFQPLPDFRYRPQRLPVKFHQCLRQFPTLEMPRLIMQDNGIGMAVPLGGAVPLIDVLEGRGRLFAQGHLKAGLINLTGWRGRAFRFPRPHEIPGLGRWR